MLILKYFPLSLGRKIERSLSARRRESSDSFVPTRPMLVKSKTLDRPPSSWEGQSESFNMRLTFKLYCSYCCYC